MPGREIETFDEIKVGKLYDVEHDKHGRMTVQVKGTRWHDDDDEGVITGIVVDSGGGLDIGCKVILRWTLLGDIFEV